MNDRNTVNLIVLLILITAYCFASNLHAAEYALDSEHSFVQFRVQPLDFSWLYGRFNKICGEFRHDPKTPQGNRNCVRIDTTSVDTNHAERDKPLREARFLDAEKYSTAIFESTQCTGDDQRGVLVNF